MLEVSFDNFPVTTINHTEIIVILEDEKAAKHIDTFRVQTNRKILHDEWLLFSNDYELKPDQSYTLRDKHISRPWKTTSVRRGITRHIYHVLSVWTHLSSNTIFQIIS